MIHVTKYNSLIQHILQPDIFCCNKQCRIHKLLLYMANIWNFYDILDTYYKYGTVNLGFFMYKRKIIIRYRTKTMFFNLNLICARCAKCLLRSWSCCRLAKSFNIFRTIKFFIRNRPQIVMGRFCVSGIDIEILTITWTYSRIGPANLVRLSPGKRMLLAVEYWSDFQYYDFHFGQLDLNMVYFGRLCSADIYISGEGMKSEIVWHIADMFKIWHLKFLVFRTVNYYMGNLEHISNLVNWVYLLHGWT